MIWIKRGGIIKRTCAEMGIKIIDIAVKCRLFSLIFPIPSEIFRQFHNQEN
ncbi:hypothetical protein METP3_01749 [Methanosarcinales archaeon]|nr:hypothetical protein METP3_01749 [Methanosarcinales archaeon]